MRESDWSSDVCSSDLGAGKSSFIEAFGTYLCKKGFKAVSYTHLDVYKRQPLWLPNLPCLLSPSAAWTRNGPGKCAPREPPPELPLSPPFAERRIRKPPHGLLPDGRTAGNTGQSSTFLRHAFTDRPCSSRGRRSGKNPGNGPAGSLPDQFRRPAPDLSRIRISYWSETEIGVMLVLVVGVFLLLNRSNLALALLSPFPE